MTGHAQQGNWRIWWRLTRPPTLTAAVMPVLIGTALGASIRFRLLPFLAMLMASLLIQAGTNMFNEYYDWRRGLDSPESVGIGGAIVHQQLSPRTVQMAAVSAFAIAALFGLYLCIVSSWWVGLAGLACMAVGFLYTGGPHPIAYTAWGELAAGLCMGPAIVLIAFFVQVHYLTWAAWWNSIPIGLVVSAILTANNLRDYEEDWRGGRRTLVIRLGPQRGVYWLSFQLILALLWTLGLIAGLHMTPWLLLGLLTIPKLRQVVRDFGAAQGRLGMRDTAGLHFQFGLLYALGLTIALIHFG